LKTLLTTAAAGRAEPSLIATLRRTRDARGRKGADDNGLPSIRSLKRWLSAPDLTPLMPQPDMSVPAWAKVFLACYQKPQKPSVEAAYREACATWTADERPSIHQVWRWLGKVAR